MAIFRRVYAKNHPYFLTVTTEYRKPILIENIDLLRESFRNSKKYFEYEIDSIVILPDHFHTIILPKDEMAYPNIIKSIKTYFSKNRSVGIPAHETPKRKSLLKKREAGIWQRRFYEHTIRNEKELIAYRDYIHYNPVKHKLVSKAKEWEFSSFEKFVKKGYYDEEWCDFGDDMDLL